MVAGVKLRAEVVETPLKATVAGENTQLYPATETGAPVAQASETDPEKPAPGATVRVPLPVVPAANTMGLGERLMLKELVCARATRLGVVESSAMRMIQ